jgi:hypothetical protein
MVDAFDLKSQGTDNSALPAEAQTENKAQELRKYLEANPDIGMTMFKVFAHLYDEPKQVKTA